MTAGKFVGIAVNVGFVQTDLTQQLPHARKALFFGAEGLVDNQRFFDDLADAHTRVERTVRILKNDLHVLAILFHFLFAQPGDVVAVVGDRALGRLDQTQQRAQQGRLSAAGFAADAERLALVKLYAHIVYRLDVGGFFKEPFLDGKPLPDMTAGQQNFFFTHGWPPRTDGSEPDVRRLWRASAAFRCGSAPWHAGIWVQTRTLSGISRWAEPCREWWAACP